MLKGSPFISNGNPVSLKGNPFILKGNHWSGLDWIGDSKIIGLLVLWFISKLGQQNLQQHWFIGLVPNMFQRYPFYS